MARGFWMICDDETRWQAAIGRGSMGKIKIVVAARVGDAGVYRGCGGWVGYWKVSGQMN
jgi:hypothetical protein